MCPTSRAEADVLFFLMVFFKQTTPHATHQAAQIVYPQTVDASYTRSLIDGKVPPANRMQTRA
jgi:biopolymer transport protein ExbD